MWTTLMRMGLEDQRCDTSKSCVLCTLEKQPQLQLRGSCPQQPLDLRYTWRLEDQISGLYRLEGWADTSLRWKENR